MSAKCDTVEMSLTLMIIAMIMIFVVKMVRWMRESDVITNSWGKIIITMILVIEMVRQVRVSGCCHCCQRPSGLRWHKQ